nr:LEAF RUST 10 DISEASE-RESISTANCE LOCUS RECEPTOR-LIKE PROTEIN KINASE-like 2.1 [Ipomoea batatas]
MPTDTSFLSEPITEMDQEQSSMPESSESIAILPNSANSNSIDVQENNICSFPKYDLAQYRFSGYHSSYDIASTTYVPIIFLSCPFPMKSSAFVETTKECWNNKSSGGRNAPQLYSYAKVGRLYASDLRISCRVELITMTSLRIQEKNVSSSLLEIHDALMYGFELFWFNAVCYQSCLFSHLCYLDNVKREVKCNGTHNTTHYCNPSSCGSIRNISSPFRLNTDPENCGNPDYQLTCDEQNRTVLTLKTQKYYVQSINYDNYTVRVVDSGVQQNNMCSFPRYALAQYSFDERISCRVELITMTSWRIQEHVSSQKVSLVDIHDALMYGFELSWFPVVCQQHCGSTGCYFDFKNEISCDEYHFNGTPRQEINPSSIVPPDSLDAEQLNREKSSQDNEPEYWNGDRDKLSSITVLPLLSQDNSNPGYPQFCAACSCLSLKGKWIPGPPLLHRLSLQSSNPTTSNGMLALQSRKYYVQSINYDNYTVRVVDPGVQQNNICSFPRYAFAKYNFFRYDDSYPYDIATPEKETPSGRLDTTLITVPIIFLRCPFPMKSSAFVETTEDCWNESSDSYGGYTYAKLTCEQNRTVLTLKSQKYFVQSINYNNFTIRVVDPGVQDNNLCSFPRYALAGYNFSGYLNPYAISRTLFRWEDVRPLITLPIIFFSCPFPVNSSTSSAFVETTKDCANNKNSGGYAYAKLGPLNASDLRISCQVDLITMTSWRIQENMSEINATSLLEIHDALMYGFELFWIPALCQQHCGWSRLCYLGLNNEIYCEIKYGKNEK